MHQGSSCLYSEEIGWVCRVLSYGSSVLGPLRQARALSLDWGLVLGASQVACHSTVLPSSQTISLIGINCCPRWLVHVRQALNRHMDVSPSVLLTPSSSRFTWEEA